MTELQNSTGDNLPFIITSKSVHGSVFGLIQKCVTQLIYPAILTEGEYPTVTVNVQRKWCFKWGMS